MKLAKEVTELMGQKVDYCRARPKKDEHGHLTAETEHYHGKGVVVGVIIAANRRIQIMVKDDSNDTNAAISLDLMCINPTKQEAEAYFNHHTKVKTIVEEHNVAQKQREADKIKEVDDLNLEMFGAGVEV